MIVAYLLAIDEIIRCFVKFLISQERFLSIKALQRSNCRQKCCIMLDQCSKSESANQFNHT